VDMICVWNLARIIREGPGLAAWRGLIGIVFVASMTR